jgi:polysaccharide export outer membrane protein
MGAPLRPRARREESGGSVTRRAGHLGLGFVIVAALAAAGPLGASQTAPAATAPTGSAAPPDMPSGVETPADYIIGPDDVLLVMFWREKELSGECVVRPDGMISLPLVNDIQAAGLTPEELRLKVMEAASRFVQDPAATVVVKAINSRVVYITGQVAKPGPYPLTSKMTVMQLVARAGGLLEFANGKRITILRTSDSQTRLFKFNYNDVAQGKQLSQNIELKPGDTVVVPN